MTTKFVWSELKKLVVIDHEINQIRKKITAEEQQLESLRAPLVTIEADRDAHANTAREAKKRIDTLELSVRRFRDEQTKKKAVLDTLTQPSQYHAMERELAELERNIVGLETQMLSVMEAQEEAQRAHDAAVKHYQAAEQELATAQAEISATISEQKEEMVVLEKKWEAQASHVPTDLSKGYTEIRARVPNPVVPVVSSSCSACFYNLLYQDTIAMNQQTVIRCRGCYRFLFIPDATTETLAS